MLTVCLVSKIEMEVKTFYDSSWTTSDSILSKKKKKSNNRTRRIAEYQTTILLTLSYSPFLVLFLFSSATLSTVSLPSLVSSTSPSLQQQRLIVISLNRRWFLSSSTISQTTAQSQSLKTKKWTKKASFIVLYKLCSIQCITATVFISFFFSFSRFCFPYLF